MRRRRMVSRCQHRHAGRRLASYSIWCAGTYCRAATIGESYTGAAAEAVPPRPATFVFGACAVKGDGPSVFATHPRRVNSRAATVQCATPPRRSPLWQTSYYFLCLSLTSILTPKSLADQTFIKEIETDSDEGGHRGAGSRIAGNLALHVSGNCNFVDACSAKSYAHASSSDSAKARGQRGCGIVPRRCDQAALPWSTTSDGGTMRGAQRQDVEHRHVNGAPGAHWSFTRQAGYLRRIIKETTPQNPIPVARFPVKEPVMV